MIDLFVFYLLTKVFETITYYQRYECFENFLNKFLRGFRKAHSMQFAFFRPLQQWLPNIDLVGSVVTILMDVSKAHDCLPHNVLTVKSQAYELVYISRTFML